MRGWPGKDAALLLVQATIQVVHQRALRDSELAVLDIRNVQIRRAHQFGILEPLPLPAVEHLDFGQGQKRCRQPRGQG